MCGLPSSLPSEIPPECKGIPPGVGRTNTRLGALPRTRGATGGIAARGLLEVSEARLGTRCGEGNHARAIRRRSPAKVPARGRC